MRRMECRSGLVPSPHALFLQVQPRRKIAELMDRPAFASLAESKPLRQAMLSCRVNRLRCKAKRGLRLVLRHETMRGNAQGPGKAVCVFFVTRMRYRCFDEPRARFRKPGQDLRLARINST